MPQINASTFQLDKVISKAYALGASDVDIFPGQPFIYRIDGLLQPDKDGYIVSKDDTEKMVHRYLSDSLQKETYNKRHSYDICLAPSEVFQSDCRVRVQFHEAMGLKLLSCRLIPLKPIPMGELGIPDEIQNWMRRSGIIIVSGHFGVGKTTTLAAMVDYINKTEAIKVKVLEDPLEFVHTNNHSFIIQVEVGKDTPTYTNGVMDMTRQFVDAAVIGEIRNREAMEAAFSMAEAGMKVYTSIHARSAIDTIDRVANLFAPGDYEQICKRLSRTLNGILFQKLLPKDKGGRVLVPEYMENNNAVHDFLAKGDLEKILYKLKNGGGGLKFFDTSYEEMAKSGIFGERRQGSR